MNQREHTQEARELRDGPTRSQRTAATSGLPPNSCGEHSPTAERVRNRVRNIARTLRGENPHRNRKEQERFEELREFILDWHGAEEARGRRIIGRDKKGRAIALLCEGSKPNDPKNIITARKLDLVLDEAKSMGLKLPATIWADASTAPISRNLFKIHQITGREKPIRKE